MQGNFAPVSVVGTSNLGTSQTPVEQPEDTQPRYSETPTPFYLNAARNKVTKHPTPHHIFIPRDGS